MLFSLKERGQGMVEYALILVLVAVVVIVALSTLGGGITGVLNKVNSSMQFFCTKKGVGVVQFLKNWPIMLNAPHASP